MADGAERQICDVVTGDEVVGFTLGDPIDRGNYVATRVTAASCVGEREVYEYTLDNGTVFCCTPDHKWFTGRVEIGRATYAAIGDDLSRYHGVKEVRQMYQQRECRDKDTALWLGGIFDGEGCISSKTLHISQSPEHNPEVCTAIERALSVLGFAYGTWNREAGYFCGRNSKASRTYYLNDGKQATLDFIRWCEPVKRQRIMDQAVLVGRKSRKLRVVKAERVGVMPVYGIETQTGNYIAYGLLSKNSAQLLLNPTAGHAQGFKDEWLRYHESDDGAGMNKYILGDPAGEKKRNSDYTALGVIGLGADNNYYLLDMVRDRLSLTERGDALFALHRRWKPKGVGYEKYGIMSDIEHFNDRMRRENYHFEITPVGGQVPKPDRIKRLVPVFEQGRFYLPETCGKVDYEGKYVDLVQSFRSDEYLAFPVPAHDDMLDMMSRIFDIETVWPRAVERREDRYARPERARRRGGSAWAA